MALVLAAGLVTAPGTLGPLDCDRVTSAKPGYTFSGRVLRNSDGDTFDLSQPGGCVRVRLTDFDAPEVGEPGAKAATQALRRITAGKAINCAVQRGRNRSRSTVSHERVLARCATGGVPLGQQMKRAGVREGGR